MNISNYIVGLAVLLSLAACGGNKKEQEAAEKAKTDSLSRPENVALVSAIAKVEPANGLIELSAEEAGVVTEVYKQEGDTVKKGQAIFRLENQSEALDVTAARQQIATQKATAAANAADIRQYEASLREKEEDLAVTRRLAETGADTRQNVSLKQRERDVILANLAAAKARYQASRAEVTSLNTKLSQSKLTAQNRVVTAKEDGVLVSLIAKKGVAVNALTPYGTLAPKGDLVLHGEIDEMFADRVQIGQPVTVYYVGNKSAIAEGKVSYLASILDSKSLFYETTGETSDRRVRRFKVTLTSPQSLLINAKVECKIKIK